LEKSAGFIHLRADITQLIRELSEFVSGARGHRIRAAADD